MRGAILEGEGADDTRPERGPCLVQGQRDELDGRGGVSTSLRRGGSNIRHGAARGRRALTGGLARPNEKASAEWTDAFRRGERCLTEDAWLDVA